MSKKTGYVIGHGRSLIDGAPIVVIATIKSRNVKTGDMVQTWILRQDIAPLDAAKNGADVSICGDCKHRPILGGACYVDLSRAPYQVFKAFQRGAYPDISNNPDAIAAIGAGRKVRIGSYGDPMAVPAVTWANLCRDASGHSGYSHQWRNTGIDAGQRDAVMALCMASADTPAEKSAAKSLGYRTFRVRLAQEQLDNREIVCPASDEAGNKTTCAKCCACSGSVRASAADIAIVVHGSMARRFILIREVSHVASANLTALQTALYN